MEMIPNSYLRKVRAGAAKRHILFNVTTEYLTILLQRQEERCALSGIPIQFGNGSASLDRIDSTKGYVKNNVQWTHRTINLMKGSMREEQFIEFCRMVVEKFND